MSRTVFGEAHLRRILAAHSGYYNELRPHPSLNKDAPLRRQESSFRDSLNPFFDSIDPKQTWRDRLAAEPGDRFRQGSTLHASEKRKEHGKCGARVCRLGNLRKTSPRRCARQRCVSAHA
jgi:hypothetical protein